MKQAHTIHITENFESLKFENCPMGIINNWFKFFYTELPDSSLIEWNDDPDHWDLRICWNMLKKGGTNKKNVVKKNQQKRL